MNLQERLEGFWNNIRDQGYYLVGLLLIVLFPFIIQTSNLPPVPIISNIYATGRDINLFSANTFVLRILSLSALYAIFAVSWDFLSGYTGQFNFGHAIFIGLSAYIAYWVGAGIAVTDLIIPEFLGQTLVIPFGALSGFFGQIFVFEPLYALLIAALVSSLFALLIGIIALRLKGYYLALLTLILPIIAVQFVVIFADITGGTQGVSGIPRILESGIETASCNILCVAELNRLNFFILTAIIMIISIGIMMLLAFSRIGLAFQSIREDADAAESLGINITFYKVLAFVVSAFFAGIAGVLFSQSSNFIGSNLFGAGAFSFRVIIMVIIGGVGTISGGIVGAFLLTLFLELFLDDVFSEIAGLDVLAFGILLIVVLRYLPNGITRAQPEQKRAIIIGILIALSWAILPSSNLFDYLTSFALEGVLTFLTYVLMFFLALPAIPVFFISEFIGLNFFQYVLGLDIAGSTLIKAKFVIYLTVGVPYAYYFPKFFKKVRLKYWGVWPSAGQYEPD